MTSPGVRLRSVARAVAAVGALALGVIAEVGIVDKQLSSRGSRKTFRFLKSFRPYL